LFCIYKLIRDDRCPRVGIESAANASLKEAVKFGVKAEHGSRGVNEGQTESWRSQLLRTKETPIFEVPACVHSRSHCLARLSEVLCRGIWASFGDLIPGRIKSKFLDVLIYALLLFHENAMDHCTQNHSYPISPIFRILAAGNQILKFSNNKVKLV
jgi:hypothetical protein